MLEIIVSLRS